MVNGGGVRVKRVERRSTVHGTKAVGGRSFCFFFLITGGGGLGSGFANNATDGGLDQRANL